MALSAAAKRNRLMRARRDAGIEGILDMPYTNEMIDVMIDDGDIRVEDSRDHKKLVRAIVKRARLPLTPEVP